MAIMYTEETKEFHLFNKQVSYVLQVLPNGQLGNLYYGKYIRHRADFSYLLEGGHRPLAVYTKERESISLVPSIPEWSIPQWGREISASQHFSLRSLKEAEPCD